MSNAIKPPGVGGSPPLPEDVATPKTGSVQPGSSGEGFRSALESGSPPEGRSSLEAASAAAPAEGTPSTTAASASEGVRGIAAELRAGRIDASEAVERLLQRTLAGPAVGALPPAERARLESMLRASLAEDPTLASMQKDLSRGR